MAELKRAAAIVSAVVVLATMVGSAGAGDRQEPFRALTCFGRAATIVAEPGREVVGTPNDDVIIGTQFGDEIDGRGGRDLICAGAGNDVVRGGPGADKIDLGRGDDTAFGAKGSDVIRGRGGDDNIEGQGGRDRLLGGNGADEISGGGRADVVRGNRGHDVLLGGGGPDSVDGGPGNDECRGGAGGDTHRNCETRVDDDPEGPEPSGIADSFDGSGQLQGYETARAAALPDVRRYQGRYRAALVNNDDNQTLHYHQDQGRLDARLVEFPFDVVVRNIGIGTMTDSQEAPSGAGNPYLFAGVQVHVEDLDSANSSHVVVGHRGGTHLTVEGKNTRNGSSSVNDVGANAAPAGRADIRIVGNADRTLTVYWQEPKVTDGQRDNWNLYNGTGVLPGPAPDYGHAVYLGLVTYAYGQTGVPFVGTADAIE